MSINLSNIECEKKSVKLRIEPGMAGWEAQTPPLCYAVPQPLSTSTWYNSEGRGNGGASGWAAELCLDVPSSIPKFYDVGASSSARCLDELSNTRWDTHAWSSLEWTRVTGTERLLATRYRGWNCLISDNALVHWEAVIYYGNLSWLIVEATQTDTLGLTFSWLSWRPLHGSWPPFVSSEVPF